MTLKKQKGIVSCPACEEEYPELCFKVSTGKLVHLDLFACAEYGTIYVCDNSKALMKRVTMVDAYDNPIFDSEFQAEINIAKDEEKKS